MIAALAIAFELLRRSRASDNLSNMYDWTVTSEQEVDVPITKLYISPMRACKLIEVSKLIIQENQVLYDRLFCMVLKRKPTTIVEAKFCPQTYALHQELVFGADE